MFWYRALYHGCQITNAGGLNADAQLCFEIRNMAVTNNFEVSQVGCVILMLGRDEANLLARQFVVRLLSRSIISAFGDSSGN